MNIFKHAQTVWLAQTVRLALIAVFAPPAAILSMNCSLLCTVTLLLFNHSHYTDCMYNYRQDYTHVHKINHIVYKNWTKYITQPNFVQCQCFSGPFLHVLSLFPPTKKSSNWNCHDKHWKLKLVFCVKWKLVLFYHHCGSTDWATKVQCTYLSMRTASLTAICTQDRRRK